MEKTINFENLNNDAYVKAVEMLRVTFPYFSEDWVQACIKRLADVEYEGKDKWGRDVFKVKRNSKIDGEPTRKRGDSWKHRKVILGKRNNWCSCFFGPYSYVREKKWCSHIGACLLFTYYFKVSDTFTSNQKAI
jgi:hypothetical protein